MNKTKNISSIVSTTVIIAAMVGSLNAQPPAGYYNNATGKTCAALKTALRGIISNGINARSYADLKTQNTTYEIKPRTVGTGSANVIYDIYSSIPGGTDPYQFTPGTTECGSYNGESDCYNREHSVPQSWFGGGTSPGPGTDFLHIYPTDGYVNGKRGNQPYGQVSSPSWTSLNGSKYGPSSVAGLTGNVFEPLDSFKGDVARSFLYFVTMYENNMVSYAANADAVQAFAANTFPSVKIEFLKLMIKWHKLDPVSTKEKNRNNAAYTFQNNRNPFIDHPEWVDSVWNAACPGLSALPVNFTFFTGVVNNNILHLNWTITNEVNVKNYEIEQSVNGIQFTTIGKVEAQNLQEYSFNINIDDIKGRRVYYRIKNVDNNGKFSYSEVFTIHIPAGIRMSVYPNPAIDNVSLQINTNGNNKAVVTITDFAGRVVLQKNVTVNNGLVNINTENISNGTYLIQAKINNEIVSGKLTINK